MQFETDRADIQLTSYDFVANQLIFKATVPETFEGTIYEVGLYSHSTNSMNQSNGSRILLEFDGLDEIWTTPGTGAVPTYSVISTRVGSNTMQSSPAASTTGIWRLEGMYLNLSGYSNADAFSLAYNVTSNVANIKIRFMTDATNYYEFTLTSPGAGYRVDVFTKGSATVVGTPSWDNVNMVEIAHTATAAGASTVRFDALRIEDVDTPNPDYIMIARELLPTPIAKEIGRSQEIEFAFTVTV